MFVIGDEVGRTKVLVERTKAEVTSDLQRLRQSVNNWETTVDLVMKKTEERVLKQLNQEVKHINDRLQQELAERHELDKRIAMLEIKFQLLAANDNSGGGGGGGDATACRADQLPPLIEAYERQKRTDAAFNAVSVQVERLQTRLDLMSRQQERAQLPSPTRHVVLEDMEVLTTPAPVDHSAVILDDPDATPTQPVSPSPVVDDRPQAAHQNDVTPEPVTKDSGLDMVIDDEEEAAPLEPEPTPTRGSIGGEEDDTRTDRRADDTVMSAGKDATLLDSVSASSSDSK